MRDKLPEYVDYFSDNPQDAYFDTTKKIHIFINHIMDNFDRFPKVLQSFPCDILINLISTSELTMKKRIMRNNRLVVPQYYNKQIAYLAPLNLANEILPLAIEKQENTYRINTAFTHGMAYCNARLIMKPESNWLTNDSSKKSGIKPMKEELLFD